MTINPTNEPRPDAKSEIAAALPSAVKTQPAAGVSPAPSEPDLESRIKTRRAEVITKLGELRADSRLDTAAAGDKLKAKLSEVAHIIKEGVVDGWANLGDSVKNKLDHWLAESEARLAESAVLLADSAPQTPAKSKQ